LEQTDTPLERGKRSMISFCRIVNCEPGPRIMLCVGVALIICGLLLILYLLHIKFRVFKPSPRPLLSQRAREFICRNLMCDDYTYQIKTGLPSACSNLELSSGPMRRVEEAGMVKERFPRPERK
jgi:hypothetical protein